MSKLVNLSIYSFYLIILIIYLLNIYLFYNLEYDLSKSLIQYLDLHMIFPILKFLREKNVFFAI